jgi:hypothetical protein
MQVSNDILYFSSYAGDVYLQVSQAEFPTQGIDLSQQHAIVKSALTLCINERRCELWQKVKYVPNADIICSL